MAEEIPKGFHRMPDGRIMANNPATAIAPPGYYLRSNGILIKLDEGVGEAQASPPPKLKPGEVPPGFHKMPDGRLMANNPASAVAPPGYHMMPDGTLMSNTGGGGHHHGAGMWMFDIKYERMFMSGLLDTTNYVAPSVAADLDGKYGYMMAPTEMSMDMVMLMIMYGVTDDFMLMLMPHYMKNDMEMLSDDGTRSHMHTSGVADTVFSAMLQGPHNLTFNVGVSLPTGSIDLRGPMTHTATSTEPNVKYPYGMQMGSGSFDMKQGISYKDGWKQLSWGAAYEYTAPLNKNKHGYRRGYTLLVDGWMELQLLDYVSAHGKMRMRSVGQIVGEDKEIVALGYTDMSPAMNPSNYGGTRIDATGILKFHTPSKMYNLSLELTLPAYQNLWGPQMATKWIAGMNIGAMFH